MRRALLVGAASILLGAAPVQCGDPEPVRYARRDDASEVVWRLGLRLRERGHAAAALDTFRYLVERYPSSRWAARARAELESAEVDEGARGGSAEATP